MVVIQERAKKVSLQKHC